MSTSPVPPPGYRLEDVPDFLKSTAANMKVEVEPPNGIDIAKVTAENPDTVQVNQRDQFGQPQLNHEVTHGYQFGRNPVVVQQMESDLASGKLPKTYTYGGVEGLLEAQKQHKTIADFGPEQQAEMVKDFQEKTKEAIAKGDPAMLDRVNQAYGPFVKQLAALPDRSDPMKTINTVPDAPGLPPAAESGLMAEDKLLGSEMKVVPPKGYRLEKHHAATQR